MKETETRIAGTEPENIKAKPAREERPGKRSLPRPWEAIPPRQSEGKSCGMGGHIALSIVSMCLMVLLVHFFRVPNPNIILVAGLTVYTSLYGLPAGIPAAAVMLLYSMYFFSEGHSLFAYSVPGLQKLAATILGVTLNVAFIGRLKSKQEAAHKELLRINAMLRDDNLCLAKASFIDGLTETRNRFAFRRDYIKYQRKSIHAMMFDLDNFKRINDSCGHATGDFVLQNVGEALGEAFGPDFCYRYGGDEFLVIRPDMDEEAFTAKVEEVREKLRHLSLDGKPVPARFSAGYVYGTAELSIDLRLMLRHADHNLYAAKEQGKDQFCGSPYSREFAEKLSWNQEARTGEYGKPIALAG